MLRLAAVSQSMEVEEQAAASLLVTLEEVGQAANLQTAGAKRMWRDEAVTTANRAPLALTKVRMRAVSNATALG